MLLPAWFSGKTCFLRTLRGTVYCLGEGNIFFKYTQHRTPVEKTSKEKGRLVYTLK